MEWKSKPEVEDTRSELEGETGKRLESAEKNRGEVEATTEALGAGDSPALDETRDALNEIATEFAADAGNEIEKEAESVGEGIDHERTDLSDPLREGAEGEKSAVSEMEARSEGTGRYVERLTAAARGRSEAADFLGGMAEGNDGHQEESRGKIEELSEEARRLAEAIRRF